VSDGMDGLIRSCRNKNTISAPSCTMRFHPSIKNIRDIVKGGSIGKPQAFTYHSGQYLPDWHPWESYKDFYVSRRETGAAREIVPFELVWLTWIFGDIEKVTCMKDKISDLEADIDDVYQVIMKFDSNVLGHIMVDVISRSADRSLKIFCEKGVIFWEWGKKIRVYDATTKKWSEIAEKKGTTVKGYD
jgi:predicted dehydrogenase